MSLNLINSFGTVGTPQGLYKKQADVIDQQYLSQFFVVSEFHPLFTAGKNFFAFNGSTYLKSGSPIQIECLDSQGNNLYVELAKTSNVSAVTYAYKESSTFLFSIYVFGDTPEGVGHIILYGTLIDGRTVKWMQNITINKTLKNTSRTLFYQAPILEVESAEVPVLSSNVSIGLINNVQFMGNVQGMSISPSKGTNLSTINKRTTDNDYRLILINPIATSTTPSYNSFNSQMIGETINLNINQIQDPLSHNFISVSQTQSYKIVGILNNNTIQIDTPYYYKDQYGNSVSTNIIDADFSIQYPFVNYNNTTASYQTTNIGGTNYLIQQSYADITYRNIRTFSGYVARHKIYRKSLVSNADYTIMADEPIVVNEMLKDNLTHNSFYNILGKFNTKQQIINYWFTSSNNIALVPSPDVAIDSMFVTYTSTNNVNFTGSGNLMSTWNSLALDFNQWAPSWKTPINGSGVLPAGLMGSNYFMVKNDSFSGSRNATYIPFDEGQFESQYGAAYDSNFINLKANVQYILEVSTTLIKDPQQTDAELSFYFTSSIPAAQQDPAWRNPGGILLTTLIGDMAGQSRVDFNDFVAFYTPQNDLYGTMLFTINNCNAYIKNISFRVFGDDGFSPDVYETRIPWPISVANECFDIKAELFDVNNNLIYSDLEAIQGFDPSGSSLIPYSPIGSNYANLYVSGSLFVSQSAVIQQNITINNGDIYIPNILPRPAGTAVSQSRLLSVAPDGSIVFDPIVDLSFDNKYLYLTMGSPSSRMDTSQIVTGQSLNTQYNSFGGRKIYWVTGSKVVETYP